MPNPPPNLPCPRCGGRLDVKDSRPTTFRASASVRRRRRCAACSYTMTTYEITDTMLIDTEAQLNAVMRSARRDYEELGVMIAIYEQTVSGGEQPRDPSITTKAA